jgi:ubiquinone/menaquinone biosynthesis C-methylase UbiE
MMDEETLKQVAAQLRKPEGEAGKQVGLRMNTGNELMNRAAIAALAIEPGDNILEIGMGNGYFVKDILQYPDVTYSGCDYSLTMVEEAIALNPELVKTARAAFLLAQAHTLPFKDQTFSKAFTVNTIYFWEDPARELGEINRVLQPGALLVIAIRPKHSMQNYPFVQYGFRLFETAEVQNLLHQHGFTVTHAVAQQEPPQDLGGHTILPEHVIVCAQKK